jgi:hypothetical protein
MAEIVRLFKNGPAKSTQLEQSGVSSTAARIGDRGTGVRNVYSTIQGKGASTSVPICEIDRIVATVAQAMASVGSVGQVMALKLEEAARGTRDASPDIVNTTPTAADIRAAANKVMILSRALAIRSGELRAVVQPFLSQRKTV